VLLYQQVFHIIDMSTKFGRLVSLVCNRGFSTSSSVQKGGSEQGVKSLNLCSAINQALHIALDSDPRLVSLFIYFMKIYLVRVWEVIRVYFDLTFLDDEMVWKMYFSFRNIGVSFALFPCYSKRWFLILISQNKIKNVGADWGGKKALDCNI